MTFPSWLKRTPGVRHVPGPSARGGRRKPAGRTLCLEQLEDRMTPAIGTGVSSLSFGDGTVIPIAEYDWAQSVEVIASSTGSGQTTVSTGQVDLGQFHFLASAGSTTAFLAGLFGRDGQAPVIPNPVVLTTTVQGQELARWTLDVDFISFYRNDPTLSPTNPLGTDEFTLVVRGVELNAANDVAGTGSRNEPANGAYGSASIPTGTGQFLTFEDTGRTLTLTAVGPLAIEAPRVESTATEGSLFKDFFPGNPHVVELQVTLPLGQASGELLTSITGRERNPAIDRQTVRLLSRARDSSLEWVLREAFLSAYSVRTDANGLPQDTFTLHFDGADVTVDAPASAAAAHTLTFGEGTVIPITAYDWAQSVEIIASSTGNDQTTVSTGQVDLGQFHFLASASGTTSFLVDLFERNNGQLPDNLNPVTLTSISKGSVTASWTLDVDFISSYRNDPTVSAANPLGADEFTLVVRGVELNAGNDVAGTGSRSAAPNGTYGSESVPTGVGHFLTFEDSGRTLTLTTVGPLAIEVARIEPTAAEDSLFKDFDPGDLHVNELQLTLPLGQASGELLYSVRGPGRNPAIDRQTVRLLSRAEDGSSREWVLHEAFLSAYSVRTDPKGALQNTFTLHFVPANAVVDVPTPTAPAHTLTFGDGTAISIRQYDWTEKLDVTTSTGNGPTTVVTGQVDLGQFHFLANAGSAASMLVDLLERDHGQLPDNLNPVVLTTTSQGQVTARWTLDVDFISSYRNDPTASTANPLGTDEFTLVVRGVELDAANDVAGTGSRSNAPNGTFGSVSVLSNAGYFLTFEESGRTLALTNMGPLAIEAPRVEGADTELSLFKDFLPGPLRFNELRLTLPSGQASGELLTSIGGPQQSPPIGRQSVRVLYRAEDGSSREWLLRQAFLTAYNVDSANSVAQDTFTLHFDRAEARVNAPPSFVKGPDQTVLEDSGAQSIPNWATNVSPGSGDIGQVVIFQVSSDNDGLFSAAPAVDASGTLTYTPAANASGSSTVTVTANDGQSFSNTFTQTFLIAVTSVNDAPSFEAISSQTVNEDAGPQTLSIAAVAPGPTTATDETNQTVTLIAVSSNGALVANPTITGTGPTRTLSYQSAPNANGIVTITVTANDGQSVNSSFTRTFTITVIPINDANLSVVMAQSSSPAGRLRSQVYTLVARNAGPDSASAVVATATIPLGTTFISSSLTPKSVVGNKVTWALGDIPSGGQVTAIMTVFVTSGAPSVISSTAQVSSAAQDSTASNNTTTVTASVVTVGTFAVTAPTWAQLGTSVPLTLAWTVPSGSWHELKRVHLRLRSADGALILVRFDEASNTLSLFDPHTGKFGRAARPGSAHVLINDHVQIRLANTTIEADGSTSPTVTLTLDLIFRRRSEGRTYRLAVAASDDLGNRQRYAAAGFLWLTGPATLLPRKSSLQRWL